MLQWLTSCRILTVFVGNRVREIKQASDLQFSYLPSDLRRSNWFSGPRWLCESDSSWPTSRLSVDSGVLQHIQSEWRKGHNLIEASLVVVPSLEEAPYGVIFERYSSFRKLLSVTATCALALQKLRKIRNRSDQLRFEDIFDAQRKWDLFI